MLVVNMKKGFIGPLGDDLPTVLAIMLSLTLFFSGLYFSLDTYNVKMRNIGTLLGAVDVSNSVLRYGIITSDTGALESQARPSAGSYGLDLKVYFKSSPPAQPCPDNAVKMVYFVARDTANGILPDALTICVWK